MAEYEWQDGWMLTPNGHRIPTKVRVRVDRRKPDDIVREIVSATRRAERVLNGARQAGLMQPVDTTRLEFGVWSIARRQNELRFDLPRLINAAQAALDVLEGRTPSPAPMPIGPDELPPPKGPDQ